MGKLGSGDDGLKDIVMREVVEWWWFSATWNLDKFSNFLGLGG